ncbi:pantoate--beta-alanine ligase [Swingsia samuiensis]|uniref:Pantothenate synthetase n=1 Tax=Swingsia samuiensis TaxID=1293412 RepID=A0A4Y6UL05_9PROT|nr:pantoate--beta-alanine ligase [Swingsia samuiensis]QDH17318.1 pantoate--beta-alanine ligase [Swingsia samuiensis]
MKICSTITDLRNARASLKRVGFVPTMGFLHEGHISLVREAKRQNDVVIVSIFVNPTQFSAHEDLDKYPRALERDSALLQEEGVDILFTPSADEIYPDGFSTRIDVGPLAHRIEGASRPGHFDGVATVVAKLFNIIQPDRAYFGQKDAQQCAVIQQLVRDLNIPVKIIIGDIIRNQNGLALSSRNSYLSTSQQQAATAIYRGLLHGKELFLSGMQNSSTLQHEITKIIEANGVNTVEYVYIVHPFSFELKETAEEGDLILVVAQNNNIRLLDNMKL